MNHLATISAAIMLVIQSSLAAQSQTTSGAQSSTQLQPMGQAPPQGTPSDPGVIDETLADADVPERPGSTFGGPGPRPWFSDPNVRQQLGLDENRFNQLNQSYDSAWRRYSQNVRGLGNAADPLRRERMRALRDEFERDFSLSRDTVINDPRTRDRYNQLYYQYQGYGAFEDPALQRRLNLTPQQRRQLGRAGEKWNSQMSRLGELFTLDPDSAARQYRVLQTETRERLGALLTPQQRRQWNESIGDSFEFSPESYFETDRTARNPRQRVR